jgi:hypothetical protein
MEVLKRRAAACVIDTLVLDDGTRVDYIDITVAREKEIQKVAEANAKRWGEFEKNLHLLVPHLRVNDQEITVDDLENGFSVSELEAIGEMLIRNKKKGLESAGGI